jgi:hypothetical protein
VRLLAVELQGLPLMPASASHQINGIHETRTIPAMKKIQIPGVNGLKRDAFRSRHTSMRT